ncbi:DUF3823 domain-containing protein [uncultured Proteiniphilum sp.]|uniref:DUF3823 domain-containing protein n=1 Tax=uncultured Proteiniphilum sp. TaxID=497637 RepID=UPI00260C32C6|nr:DUF3823 domain-containing protein [uncultured Proteiniphilum sp.]
MKRIKLYFLPVFLGLFVFYSCELDNYDYPDAALTGSIIDSETNELIQSDIINGTTIKIIEHGYDPVSPQYLRVKNDGTYANTLLFSNTYTVQPDQRNFSQIDEQEVKIGKDTKLDFRVTPYIRVKDAQIVKEGNNIIATFRLQQTTPDAVTKIGLYAHSQSIVGEPVYLIAAEIALNRQVTEEETFKVVINVARNTALLKPNQSYYFRIGAVSSIAGAKFNYAPSQLINVGEISPEIEPEGTSFDKCELTEGWAGGDSGPALDSDNPQEGNHSVKFQSGGGFIIQKNFAQPVNANVGLEYGVLQFHLYISDVSVINWDWPGQIEITSSGNPDSQELHWNFMSQLRLRNGWNKVVLKLSEAEVSGGNIDLTAINFFRIYHLDVQGPVEIKIDNMKFYEEY